MKNIPASLISIAYLTAGCWMEAQDSTAVASFLIIISILFSATTLAMSNDGTNLPNTS